MERAGGITLDRLERFEKALDDIINNYKELGEELEKLRNDGKNKSTWDEVLTDDLDTLKKK